jgi:ADP-ribose pyrophosphatase
MQAFEIVDETTVFSAFFDVVEAHVRYRISEDAWTPTVSRLSVERGDAVGIVVFEPEADAFWFVRQFRYAMVRHGDPFPIEIVAGKIDAPETPEEGARRELIEELGFQVTSLESLGEMYSSPGGMSEVVHLYLARVSTAERVNEGANLEDEHLIQERIESSEVFRMLADGTFRDGKTIAGLYRAQGVLSRV